MASQLIESVTTKWDPGNYRDTYRERVDDLIARKRRGEVIVREGEPAAESNVTDLMEALRASVEEMRVRRQGKSSGTAKSSSSAKSARKPASGSKAASRRKAG